MGSTSSPIRRVGFEDHVSNEELVASSAGEEEELRLRSKLLRQNTRRRLGLNKARSCSLICGEARS